MILKCPKCKSTEHLQIERRPNGDTKCMNCNFKDKSSVFNYRTQHIEKITNVLIEFGKLNIRIGQIIKIVESSLENKNKDIFYVENDELLEELKKLL